MKRIILSLFSILFLYNVYGQNIELIEHNVTHIPSKNANVFEYIESEFNLSSETIVSSYKLRIDKQGKNSLIDTFYDLWKEANKVGANSFAINGIVYDSISSQYIVDVDTHYLDNNDLEENYSMHESNVIVIFGDLNTKKENKVKSCKINKQKVEIAPYSFVRTINYPGTATNISVGGLMGTSVSIASAIGRPIECFTLGGTTMRPEAAGVSVGVGSGGHAMGGGIGFSIKTGSINPVQLDCGLFVMTILQTINPQNSKELESSN